MTDNTWNAEHYPAPQPSPTSQGERMPLVAHPPAIVAAIEARYAEIQRAVFLTELANGR